MSKRAGPSRISIFSSRIPKPGLAVQKDVLTRIPQINKQNCAPAHNNSGAPSNSNEKQAAGIIRIGTRDLGKRVRVADKDGILRFVGEVHFAPGVWCGIELTGGAVGKNDGCIRGVRYFACKAACGLMAPLAKVELIEERFEDDDDDDDDVASGPYSIIFGVGDSSYNNLQNDNKRSYFNDEKSGEDNDEKRRKNIIELVDKPSMNFKTQDSKSLKCTYNFLEKRKILDSNLPSGDCNLSIFNSFNQTIISASGRYPHEESRQETSTKLSDNSFALSKETLDESIVKRPKYTYPLLKNSKDPSDTFIRTGDSWDNLVQKNGQSNTCDSSFNINDTILLKKCKREILEKPASYPQLRNFEKLDFENNPSVSAAFLSKFSQSTPLRDIENSPRKSRFSHGGDAEDDASKRDSLEFEESLGILTPEQMIDATSFASAIRSRTPSSENVGSLPNDPIPIKSKSSDLPSPNLLDCSLGILDDHLLSFTVKSDTTMNMELPLDSVGKSKEFILERLDQTPSPEDLPLDPAPMAVESDTKTENTTTKSKTSSFITSITSITSLDTGYQGDGEMSRPASRGADNSPLTRRPLPRPQPRRPDPMTDSDFYTESDADNHEEHPLRGDRRAQVIDGTLYGVDPQAAADLYVNNRENMDSSGIFTDIESNTRTDELDNDQPAPTADASPSDTSSKTISDNSQNNVLVVINKPTSKSDSPKINQEKRKSLDTPPKRNSPSPSSATSSPSSVRSPRHASKVEPALKKYKNPKRNVTSKIKSMLEPVVQQKNNENKKGAAAAIVTTTANTITRNTTPTNTPPRTKAKAPGRWDAVMNKITKAPQEQAKVNFKDVKSKVFSSISLQPAGGGGGGGGGGVHAQNKANLKRSENATQKSPNPKLRRARTRSTANTPTGKGGNVRRSLNSSFSDLSGASPVQSNAGGAKKREVVRVLTAAKLSSPKTSQINNEVKKTATTPLQQNESTKLPKRLFSSTREKKQAPSNKEGVRGTVKGGRTSPGVRPPFQSRAPNIPAPRTIEGLAVLVQHLVFNVEAFRVPSLKREVEKAKSEIKEARLLCRHLEETLTEERRKSAAAIEEIKSNCRAEVAEMVKQQRIQIAQLNHQNSEIEQRLLDEQEKMRRHLEQIKNLNVEFTRLQKTHEESLDILREENDSIREQIDEKNEIIGTLQHYKSDYEKLRKDFEQKEAAYKEKLHAANTEINRVRDQLDSSNCSNKSGDNQSFNSSIQEVHSLQAVLELKQSEVSELRRALAEANEKADLLPFAAEKASALSARCDDLKLQLERKSLYEQQLIAENKHLQESIKDECNQKKRLSQRNEELLWKLKQNKEVLTHVLGKAEESGAFNRSILSSSFNERHSTTKPIFERTLSFRERTLSSKSSNGSDEHDHSRNSTMKDNLLEADMEDESPPSSPKVKGVVEKSDSVSYVLDLQESPEVVASRIMRRSFRNSTPPKNNTPTKSPANKRPRMKNNPLSLSASTSSIVSPNKSEHARSRSASVRNGDYDTSDDVDSMYAWASSTPNYTNTVQSFGGSTTISNIKLEDNLDLDEDHDIDIKIPSLPSEIGRKNGVQTLPTPRHLAGEAMISESNSEDETSSSSAL